MSDSEDRDLDAQLRQRFAMPVGLGARLEAHTRRAAGLDAQAATARRLRRAAAAVLLCAGVVLAILAWNARPQAPQHELQARLFPTPDLESLYSELTAVPEAVPSCAVPAGGCELARECFGLELPEAIRNLEASTCTSWPGAAAFVCRAEPGPAVLLVDRKQNDPQPYLPEGSALKLYRAETEQLVFYEVSPCPAPRLLPWMAGCECSLPLQH